MPTLKIPVYYPQQAIFFVSTPSRWDMGKYLLKVMSFYRSEYERSAGDNNLEYQRSISSFISAIDEYTQP